MIEGLARGERRVAFIFPGQGGQWDGMARDLWDSSPVFAESMEACDAALSPHLDFSLEDVLRGAPGAPELEPRRGGSARALRRHGLAGGLWRSFGVEPAAVVGHSQGEIAAAHVAGGLSLEDAALIVAARSRALAQIEGSGGMMAVALSPAELEQRASQLDGRVTVAALERSRLAGRLGRPEALDQLEADARGRRGASPPDPRQLREPLTAGRGRPRGAARGARRDRAAARARSPSTRPSPASPPTPPRWTPSTGSTTCARRCCFEPAIRAMAQAGIDALIEVGPHPVLLSPASQTLDSIEDGRAVAAIGSLRRDEGGPERFLGVARRGARAWRPGRLGAPLRGAGRVELPTYAFQRERYWLAAGDGAQDPHTLGQEPAEHPLLGAKVSLADGDGALWTGRISLADHAWLADHAVMGTIVLPGTAFVELALHAAAGTDTPAIGDLILSAPLVLEEDGAVALQVSVSGPDEEGCREVAIHSRPDGPEDEDADWTEHASGTLVAADSQAVDPTATVPPADGEKIDPESAHARLAEAGYDYGPAFRSLRRIVRAGQTFFAEVGLEEREGDRAQGFELHPALGDAIFQVAELAALGSNETDRLVVPASFAGVRLHRPAVTSLSVRLTVSQRLVGVRSRLTMRARWP